MDSQGILDLTVVSSFIVARLQAARVAFSKDAATLAPPNRRLVWTPYVRPLFGTNVLLVYN